MRFTDLRFIMSVLFVSLVACGTGTGADGGTSPQSIAADEETVAGPSADPPADDPAPSQIRDHREEPVPDAPSTEDAGDDPGCAHVIAAGATDTGGGAYSFEATVASNDTGWEKYANEWRVVAADGTILGTRVLLHPHENEQPFTRSLVDVTVPDAAWPVTIEAGDLVLGYCGSAATVDRPSA